MPKGAKMSSNVSGTVVHAGWTDGGFGNYVAIKDANGFVHIYGHMSGVNVKKGQQINVGDLLGGAGSTGRSTGSHLHYEVRKGSIGGDAVDPRPFLTVGSQSNRPSIKNIPYTTNGYNNNWKSKTIPKSKTFGTFMNHLEKAIGMGVPARWVGNLVELVGRESSWNPRAKNPRSTAHGYGQFLSSTRANYEKKTGLDYSNPVHQIVMMAQYVKDRYGTPAKALQFWDKNKWY